jgi:hypothetical protein
VVNLLINFERKYHKKFKIIQQQNKLGFLRQTNYKKVHLKNMVLIISSEVASLIFIQGRSTG